MNDPIPTQSAEFDDYARSYDKDLDKGLALSGENKEYFARKRIEWLKKCLQNKDIAFPKKILDFGCGDGGSIPFLDEILEPETIIGVDVSEECLKVARHKNAEISGAKFRLIPEYSPAEEFDLAFCNGVFHHILPDERRQAVEYVYRSLRSGGYFAFWENNPWNPGTRFVMSRVPFDKDAIMLFPSEASRLLGKTGFQVENKNFLFIFPAILKSFRAVEKYLVNFPIGGQYLLLAKK